MVNSRLVVNGVNVPVMNDIPVSVNYSNSDIREPDSIKSSWSKTVNLPMSKEVNELFELIFEVNVVLNIFNPNLKLPAIYYLNEREQFRGSLQLLKIVKKIASDGTTIPGHYECNIIGDAGAIFVSMGNKYLTDLDFSDLDHSFVYSASLFTPTVGSGYAYGFIDYGTGDTTNATWKFTDLKPGIFEREYLKRIFKQHGYTWTSTFLDSAYYKKRFIPCVDEGRLKMSQTDIDGSQFYAGQTGTGYTNSINGTVAGSNWQYSWTNYMGILGQLQYNDDFTLPFFDGAFNNYSTVTNTFTVNTAGYYNITSINNFNIVITPPAGTVTSSWQGGGPLYYTLQIEVVGGGVIASTTQVIYNYDFTNLSASLNIQATSPNSFWWAGTQFVCKLYLAMTSPFTWKFLNGGGTAITTGTTSLNLSQITSSYYASFASTDIVYGQGVVMNQTVPKLVKQRDFFKAIIQAYNLRIEPDKANPKNLIIEPYTSFYHSKSSALDWSKKFDLSKEVEISPMGELDSRVYEFQYKSDTDHLNTLYQNEFKQNFGKSITNVNNDFNVQTKTTELVFSNTPISGNTNNTMVVPKFYSQDGQSPNPVTIKPIKCNIRSVFWGGLKNCTSFTWDVNGTTSTRTTYPYVGHVDDPYSPTKDLCFLHPYRIYYTLPALSYPTDNLYNTYWSRYISEITDKNSKIVTAWFYLDETDIETFSFRYIIYADLGGGGAYYYVNKIIDYNPLVKQTTKVELLKINKFPDPSTELINVGVNGGVGAGSGASYSIYSQPAYFNYGGNYAGSGMVVGSNNNVSGGAMVIGDNNVVA